jgi:hypothetical protein
MRYALSVVLLLILACAVNAQSFTITQGKQDAVCKNGQCSVNDVPKSIKRGNASACENGSCGNGAKQATRERRLTLPKIFNRYRYVVREERI